MQVNSNFLWYVYEYNTTSILM